MTKGSLGEDAMENLSTSKNLNFRIARRLEEVGQLLEAGGGNPFRVQAYRRGAETLKSISRPVDEILRQEGEAGLRRLPGIGEGLARSIATLLITGRLPILDRLRGESDSGSLLASIPGIGKCLAARLHRDFGIDTLEQLETAAHDGRLRNIPGIGEKRSAGIIDSLSARLGRFRRLRVIRPTAEPSIAELLDVDREYREKATAGALPTIAPHRFNLSRKAWLPILHSKRGHRHFIALFSNTAHAHQMGKTRDWVVIYYDDKDGERQCTVITSERGPLMGSRIVRGRESECLEYYQQAENHGAAANKPGNAQDNPASFPTAVGG